MSGRTTARGAVVRVALFVLLALPPSRARGVQVEALDPGREWRDASLEFHGNDTVPEADLRKAMVTKSRAWYDRWRFWQPLPEFDPITFRGDLERLRQFYRNRGYYDVRIAHDIELPAEGNAVRVVIYIEQGPPVYVESVAVDLRGTPLAPADRELVLTHVPLERDDIFDQDEYERGYTYLRTYYREHGFARVEVARRAEVDVRRHAAAVFYDVDSGPPSVFGDVEVSGTHEVDPDVVRKEVAFKAGDPFKQSLVEQTRANIVALRIFRSVRIEEDKSEDPKVAVRIRVTEGPWHEVRLGVGYDTEEQIRGLASWRDYNFYGGGRQLGFSARASLIRRIIAADFLQPHFPGQRDRVRLIASEQQEEEDAYTNDRSRLSPRFEWGATRTLVPYAFYRIEYDSLSSVKERVRLLHPGIAPPNTVLSGLGFGVDWNHVDDLLDPKRGWVANASVEPVGGFLGGDVAFVRAVAEGRYYQPLPEDLIAAFRLRLGSAKPFAGTKEIPLFERFYAGGINSVRGYERWHVGRADTFVSDISHNVVGHRVAAESEPIGGRSVVEASFELRHPITRSLDGAVFLDAGQISLDSWDFPIDDLQYGAGFGVRYKSPVGPLRLDLGFPNDPPPGDPFWQVHVSIGQAF
jgi:outer membrane protein insertion porin family/translocation and assembly module TamA